MFGGPAPNPIHILASIIGQLHDDEGRVALPGFYDGVEELPGEVAAQWRALNVDEAAYMGEIGLRRSAGETSRNLLEKLWSRPTCDVNGIVGGYTGTGTKTVIPSKASAKFSFRLVGRQDPERISQTFREFVTRRVPDDCTVEFLRHGGDPGISFDLSGPLVDAARRALSEEFGAPAVMIGCGGSIPIVGSFREKLGMDSILIGFALDDDCIHSPNEKYDISSFRHGVRSWIRLLNLYGEAVPA
jgi:acetylornithine deacetylase/succinyl-diaminopimelate desuccinylase-like protein